jgi:RHS repeat-associated protein
VQRIRLTPVVGLVRRRSAATGAWEVVPEYAHRDHLGSVNVVTDGQGAVLARTSFDPFGTRRSGDWSRDLQQSERTALLEGQYLRGSRGFTDHEHRDRTGFVHMNGRVYDPRLGRFVAADPLVQTPWASQTYNRYGYVANDPVSRTDPSGFCGRQEGYQLTVCDGFEEMVVIGQRSGGGAGYFGSLNPEGGSIQSLGPVGFGGFGGTSALAGWDSLLAELQARLAAGAPVTGVQATLIEEEVLVTGEAPDGRDAGTSSWWTRGLHRLDDAGLRSLFGSACFGAVLGGCGAVALQPSTVALYGMVLVGVFPGGGVSFGSEGVLFESDFQSNSGVGTAVMVSGGVAGFGGSIGMAQGTNGVNVTGAVGYGFGLSGGVGFYYAGPIGSIGR